LAILLAASLIQVRFVMLVGAAYLLWLPYHHFTAHGDAEARQRPKQAMPWLGLSPFWATVAKVELTDIVFAIDSILVAVAMSNKLWVIITGGILGVIAMRLVIGQLLTLVNRYPALVDGAFIIIAWVGLKLVWQYLHEEGYVHVAIPQWFSLSLIAVIFTAAFVYAKLKGPVQVSATASAAADVLDAEKTLDPHDPSVHK
jgi:YkoY family integral membrane protein